eukprot:scaffold227952_cov70-Cyclotella_meneghiniana.AAC.1
MMFAMDRGCRAVGGRDELLDLWANQAQAKGKADDSREKNNLSRRFALFISQRNRMKFNIALFLSSSFIGGGCVVAQSPSYQPSSFVLLGNGLCLDDDGYKYAYVQSGQLSYEILDEQCFDWCLSVDDPDIDYSDIHASNTPSFSPSVTSSPSFMTEFCVKFNDPADLEGFAPCPGASNIE